MLDRYRRIRVVALTELGEQRLMARHERAKVADLVRRLTERGQKEGGIRSDLPVQWLVTTLFSLLHAAADEVEAGWLDPEEVPTVVEATLLPAFRAGRRD